MKKGSILIPFEVVYIIHKLKESGYQCFLVGGAVRDILINSLPEINPSQKQEIIDFDFTTDAKPNEIQEVFTKSFYTNDFGTVGVSYKHLLARMRAEGFQPADNNIKYRFNLRQQEGREPLITQADISKVHTSLQDEVNKLKQKAVQKREAAPPPFEITTYRSESMYQDFRRPKKIEWGKSIEQDLQRRDFTINAMALTINSQPLSELAAVNKTLSSLVKLSAKQYRLIDEHQGLEDLKNKLIRTVRSPDERFGEDALRMLRAIRFAVQLKMRIETVTFESIKKHAQLITKISWERISAEFLKMLSTDQPDRAIELLDETGLLSFILPEFKKTKDIEQGGHHTTDVWTHTLDSVANCPSKDPIVRLAVLLHDIGKPQTFDVKNGTITFYNHEIVSSRMADKIAKRFKLSNDQRQRLFELVRHHMFYYQPDHTDAAVRRMIKRIGINNLDDMLAIREADRLGSGAKKTSWRLEELKDRIIEQLNQPFAVTDLAIDGRDLMSELNLRPGPIIGDILEQLMDKVLEKPELNTKPELLREAKIIKEKLEAKIEE